MIPSFSLDLHALLAAFEGVMAPQWCAHGFGPHDAEGPCISLEGLYQGHPVWPRVLAEPPADEEPGLQLDTSASCWAPTRVLHACPVQAWTTQPPVRRHNVRNGDEGHSAQAPHSRGQALGVAARVAGKIRLVLMARVPDVMVIRPSSA